MGIEGKLQSVGHTDFLKNPVAMRLYGLFADVEPLRNLLVPAAVTDERDDFFLLFGEIDLFFHAGHIIENILEQLSVKP